VREGERPFAELAERSIQHCAKVTLSDEGVPQFGR